MQKPFIIGLFIYWSMCLLPIQADAASMQSDYYSLEKKSIDIKPYQLDRSQPIQETKEPRQKGFNYIVASTTPETSSVTLSTTLLDYGEISATSPIIRRLLLTIQSPKETQLMTIANHPLQKTDGTIIPNTTCDNGSCSAFTEALWVNALTYGFGYRTDSMETAYFKQLPDFSLNNQEAIVTRTRQQTTTNIPLTYKVNISGTQAPGSYSNHVWLIATPNY